MRAGYQDAAKGTRLPEADGFFVIALECFKNQGKRSVQDALPFFEGGTDAAIARLQPPLQHLAGFAEQGGIVPEALRDQAIHCERTRINGPVRIHGSVFLRNRAAGI